MLRSLLYAHFSETFNGLSTIRSYGEMKRFIKANRYYADLENRSLFLVVTNQRWLAIRLDLIGDLLTLIVSAVDVLFLVLFNSSRLQVALFAVTNVSGISAAQIGVILTFTSKSAGVFVSQVFNTLGSDCRTNVWVDDKNGCGG